MLIIAGHLLVSPNERDGYVEDCASVVEAARAAPGCLDFSITADSLDTSMVRIYELWANEENLVEFRGSGPSDDQQAAILGADVKRYGVSSVSEP